MGPSLSTESIIVRNEVRECAVLIAVLSVPLATCKPHAGAACLGFCCTSRTAAQSSAVKILTEGVSGQIDQRLFSCFGTPHRAVDLEAFKYL